jgi:hypothetical protein
MGFALKKRETMKICHCPNCIQACCSTCRQNMMNVRAEKQKLALGEDGWNLNGGSLVLPSRTRGGGTGRPNMARFAEDDTTSESDASIAIAEEVTASEEEPVVEEADDGDKKKAKPSASRVILEVDSLSKAIAAVGRCQDCGSEELEVEMKTICLASSVVISCKQCDFVYKAEPPPLRQQCTKGTTTTLKG